MTKKNDNDPALEAFLQAGDNIQEAIKGLHDWDACLALILALADRIVWGNTEEGEWECTVPLSRLAQSIRVLGNVVLDHIHGGDGDDDGGGEEDPNPSPSSPDLLRKLLERRRAVKAGAKPLACHADGSPCRLMRLRP